MRSGSSWFIQNPTSWPPLRARYTIWLLADLSLTSLQPNSKGLAFTFTGCVSRSLPYLFHQIHRLEGIPVEEQLLYYDAQLLVDTRTIASYGLGSLCYIDFVRTGRPLKRPRLGSASHPSNTDIELLSALPTLSRYSNMRLVALDEGSPRGAAVRRLFLDSITRHRAHLISDCPSPPCTHFAPKMKLEVVSVRRLLSRGLLDMYCVKRERIEGLRRNGCAALPEDFTRDAVRLQSVDAGTPCLNEFLLYHGSDADSINEITRGGFDPRRGGEATGHLFGHATYFAPHASKADFYANPDDSEGTYCIVASRVCLGDAFVARNILTNALRPPDGFDSMVSATRFSSPSGCVDLPEAMVFSEGQALPEYIIEYRHTDDCECQRCEE